MQTVIETKALCKQYGPHTAVDHVELHVPQGCVYGFIGPNGAGKSTTMKMLLGLIHPTAGRVRLLGQELTEKSRLPLLRQTGSLIESPAGYLHLTAQENLEIVADLKGVPHKDIGRVLDIVHLTQDRSRRVGQYSLGMKQRLGIAMALLGSPKLLILDEPTNGLDPAGIQEMRALIRNMPAATGATVLISSHLLGEMEQMVEQVGIIDRIAAPQPRQCHAAAAGPGQGRADPACQRPDRAQRQLRCDAATPAGLPAGRPRAKTGCLRRGRCGTDAPHQDAGGDFPEPDERGGGLRWAKHCMRSCKRPAAATIC